MKRSRFQYEYRKSASSLHKKVGDCLRGSPLFDKYQIYQEYPVTRINPEYQDTSHHFDWVIPDLFLVIEVHGEQHRTPTDFSGKQEDGGILEFHRLIARDTAKRMACVEAGWTYIELWPEDVRTLTDQQLFDAYNANKKEDRINEFVEPIQTEEQAARHRDTLARAREYRKASYQRAKQARKARMDSGK
jgi:hypothetical protein